MFIYLYNKIYEGDEFFEDIFSSYLIGENCPLQEVVQILKMFCWRLVSNLDKAEFPDAFHSTSGGQFMKVELYYSASMLGVIHATSGVLVDYVAIL